MTIIKSISILKLLIVSLLIKYCDKYILLLILFIYNIISTIFDIIIKTINKINYENTLKGVIFTYLYNLYSKYYYKIKICIYYTLAIIFNLISIFRKYIPYEIRDILGLKGQLNIWSCILSLLMFSYNVLSDIIKIYGK